MPGEEVKEDAVADEVADMFDLSKKKKKKKKKKVVADEGVEESPTESGAASSATGAADALPEPPAQASSANEGNYTYEQLLDRVADYLRANNPDLTERKRHVMKPPQLSRLGTKKTMWSNFQEICKMLRRNPDHVQSFFLAELGTEGSIDGSQRLILRGKFLPKIIEGLLRKYIAEYVTCQMCRNPAENLSRDAVSRLYFVSCESCGSSRSVAPIRAGYHAQTRADRRAARK